MGDEREGTAAGGEPVANGGGTRTQNVVVLGAMEPRTVQAALRPGVERSRKGGQPSAPACLVIAPTVAESLLAATEARLLLDAPALRVVPVTSAGRAKRVLGHTPVALVVGTPTDLLALRRASALQLDGVQAVVLIGLDAMLAELGEEAGAAALEAILSDVPASAVRVVSSATEHNAAVGSFLERYLPKARHVTPLVKTAQVTFNVTPQYVITSPAARTAVLRAFLDERDPPSLAVIATSDVAEAEATAALRSLGLAPDARVVQVVRGAPLGHTAAVVGWNVPATSEALTQALSGEPVEALFLINANDVPVLTAISGGAARPMTLAAVEAQTVSGVDAIHAAMRAALTDLRSVGAADLALVAPLLDEFDPVEVAAAALRLFDDARRALASAHGHAAATRAVFASPVRAAAAAASETSARSGTTRVFFNVGKRDNVRPGDLLGAIAGESGLPGDRIGSIDLFESHSLVEIASDSVETVIAKLTGVTLRGRQLHVRRDDRGAGGHAGFGAARGGSERPRSNDRARSSGAGDRGRGGERSRERGGDRGASRGGKPWEDRTGESRGGPPRDGPPRGGRPDFKSGGGERGASRGPSRGPDRGGDRGPSRGPDRGARGDSFRPDAARREFGDRSPSERTEPRREWAGRGEALSRAARPRPDSRGGRPDFKSGGNDRGGSRR